MREHAPAVQPVCPSYSVALAGKGGTSNTPVCCRNPGLAAKLEAERRLKEGISGHKTGLPKKLLELFNARPPLERKSDLKKPKPKVPHIGLAKYVMEFVEPDDPEYEPGPPKTRPSSPRRYRNPEMRAQARLDDESKLEK